MKLQLFVIQANNIAFRWIQNAANLFVETNAAGVRDQRTPWRSRWDKILAPKHSSTILNDLEITRMWISYEIKLQIYDGVNWTKIYVGRLQPPPLFAPLPPLFPW